MTLKSSLITLATVAGIACFAGQDPRLDYSFAAPKYDDPQTAAAITGQGIVYRVAEDVPSKKVSANFRNAPIADVLAWLKKQGVSYVIDESILKDKRISVNLTDQPLPVVMDAVATAMDGHWTRRGGIYVYRPGGGMTLGTSFVMPAMPDMSGHTFTAPKVDIDVRRLDDLKGKTWEGLPKTFVVPKIDNKELSDKIAKEVEEALKASKLDDPAFWDRFQKELTESLDKNLGGHPFVPNIKFAPGTFDDLKNLQVYVGDGTYKINSVDAEKFMDTVTPSQKDLMKSQGYLKVSDLTAAQREMLSIKDDANLNLVFVVKGEKIVIKSK